VVVEDFKGNTKEGICMGCTEDRIVEAFGEPEKRTERGNQATLAYDAKGLKLMLRSGKLVRFSMQPPK
jgi:hypothetical protein